MHGAGIDCAGRYIPGFLFVRLMLSVVIMLLIMLTAAMLFLWLRLYMLGNKLVATPLAAEIPVLTIDGFVQRSRLVDFHVADRISGSHEVLFC
tara:strand:+ start:169735 stop:170013 length:279 start_codon:yes stop_codon:yes gene_type:complete